MCIRKGTVPNGVHSCPPWSIRREKTGEGGQGWRTSWPAHEKKIRHYPSVSSNMAEKSQKKWALKCGNKTCKWGIFQLAMFVLLDLRWLLGIRKTSRDHLDRFKPRIGFPGGGNSDVSDEHRIHIILWNLDELHHTKEWATVTIIFCLQPFTEHGTLQITCHMGTPMQAAASSTFPESSWWEESRVTHSDTGVQLSHNYHLLI
jgi:hypothetical protein